MVEKNILYAVESYILLHVLMVFYRMCISKALCVLLYAYTVKCNLDVIFVFVAV